MLSRQHAFLSIASLTIVFSSVTLWAFKDFVPPKASPKDAEYLAKNLVRQKMLTKFQAEEISRGKGKSLTLGNYVLLEKIGQGGMGQVFKARHRRMDRCDAVFADDLAA